MGANPLPWAGCTETGGRLQVWTWVLVCRVSRQKAFLCKRPSNSEQNLHTSVRQFTFCIFLTYLARHFCFFQIDFFFFFVTCHSMMRSFFPICLYAVSFLDWTLSLLETQNKRTLILSYLQFEFAAVTENWADTTMQCWVVQNTVTPLHQPDL